MRKQRIWLSLMLAVAAVVFAGCTGGVPVSDMSRGEAEAGVEQRIRDSAAELFPDAELEPLGLNDNPCGFVNTDSYQVEHRYWIRGIPTEENLQLIDAARELWLAQGYEVRREIYDGTGRFGGVVVRGPEPDGFLLSLRRNGADNMWITSASPCIPWDRE